MLYTIRGIQTLLQTLQAELCLVLPKKAKKWPKNPGKFCHWIFNPGNKWSQISWNFLPSKEKILEFSQKKFLEFHEKLVFLEFSGPRIFHPGIFCLEIFCPGILFPGKFWHSFTSYICNAQEEARFLHGFLQCEQRSKQHLCLKGGASPVVLCTARGKNRSFLGVYGNAVVCHVDIWLQL